MLFASSLRLSSLMTVGQNIYIYKNGVKFFFNIKVIVLLHQNKQSGGAG